MRGRVSLLGLGVIALWVFVVVAGFNLLLANRLHRQADVLLRTRAAAAASTVEVSGAGVVSMRDTSGDGALDSGIWIYVDGRAVKRPDGGGTLQEQTRALTHGPSSFRTRGDYRLYSLPVRRSGTTVATVVATVSISPYERAQTEALLGSVVAALLVLAGAYPVLRFAAGRALRPVDSMTQRAGEWSATALHERFGPEQPYREVQALAATLDGVLDRLSAVVRHERTLSAELSHELRTPLARIVAETDLLLARPHSRRELDEAHAAVRHSAMAMDTILETLLSTARAEVQIAPGRCELAALLAEILHAHERSRVAGAPQVLDRVSAPLVVGVEPEIVARILAPILDNASRYARAEIVVSGRRTAGVVVLDVEDDGPGVPSELRETIFEPGRRGDPTDGHDGAGLGLALARRLARAVGGEVAVVGPDSAFRITLPPA